MEMQRRETGGLAIVVAAAACLAIAMGIGRFSYTSILPLMISEKALDLGFGGTLASVNYAGYLVGALGCMWIPNHHSSARLVRWGLVLTVLATAAMVIADWRLWLGLRFVSGVVSAVALVHAARWCMGALSRRGQGAFGSAMFMGVGLGIAVSGLVATGMIAAHWNWRAAWSGFAVVGLALTALVWRIVDPKAEVTAAPRPKGSVPSAAAPVAGLQLPVFILAYGIAGFGYIITATYLPVIARAALPPSVWLDLFWPIYGVAAAAGSLLVTRIAGLGSPRALLVGCHLMQGAGVALATVWPSLPGFVLGSVLAGLPFTAINFLAMDDAHRLQPHRPAQFIGLLTAAFAIGQILGPPLVQLVMHHTTDMNTGFDISLRIAAGTLWIGAGLYLFLMRRYPG
ncbi:YbfB/YjiJ family MFS transporter [Pseudooceanicola sp. CBS1P-1]|uniref:YbfB/YjiJ family MFS transporter n=1 Tax=Pseudooceanicola albus TaxID=2692189 RepID=A0A6L7G4C5_9RHOB|nr:MULTISPECIES: YbfB/YjiJ family MFS transporter [Pseudooceanicola]MBT9385290.1 YbfB/YjiJ family MFS transporter [Pseudooceanicola endophyticus]MXN18851.1 YbfB/YjiJ family MFS transporter [Pseudooceanicola albus]